MSLIKGQVESLPSIDAEPLPPIEETRDQATANETIDDQSTFTEIPKDQSMSNEVTGDLSTLIEIAEDQSTTSEVIGDRSMSCEVRSTSIEVTRTQIALNDVTRDQSTSNVVTGNRSMLNDVTDDQSAQNEVTGNQSTSNDETGTKSVSEHVLNSHALSNIPLQTATTKLDQPTYLSDTPRFFTEAASTGTAGSPSPQQGSGPSILGRPFVNERTLPKSIADIRSPDSNWRYNIFLNSLAEAMTSEDFRKLKFIFKDAVGKKAMEKADDPRDLFKLLEQRVFLSKDNLLFLQRALYELGRKDLIKDVVEFARSIPNTLVCYPASNAPVNGYRFVKWHLEGKDFQSCTRGDIQATRMHIAEILCIPPEFVLIAGIEPSSSLLLTLMIPDDHVEVLVEMLRKKETFPAFALHRIDKIEVNGEVFAVTGKPYPIQSDHQEQLLNVYQQLQDTERHMQSTELRCLEMDKTINKLKLDLQAADTIICSLKPKTPVDNMEQEYERCLELYRSQLEKLKKDKIEPGHVLRLLVFHCDLMNIYNKWNNIENERELRAQIFTAQRVVYANQLRTASLEGLLALTPSGKALLEGFENISMQQPLGVPILEFVLTEPAVKLLQIISSKLHEGDIDKLKQAYTLENDDVWNNNFKADTKRILEAVFYKTARSRPGPIKFETFVEAVLSTSGRNDLTKTFYEELHRVHEELFKTARDSARINTLDSNTEMMPTIKRMSEQIDFMYHKMESVSRLPSAKVSEMSAADPFLFGLFNIPQMQQQQQRFSRPGESKQ
ncbi:uncharacterized protein LOC127853677 [Dreissena polymorpha]|uniref:DED domain-containing protein n=1 Tax=Dreissena polymorpha TaxID=45954 RepID=A0A9D4CHL3_DREPO|nr:uncharacterized protein LOC127853677 [Dreissena polymorpha]KAH3725057.1 hypothetical protein DPMN_050886 [Dreissena polymorpha]